MSSFRSSSLIMMLRAAVAHVLNGFMRLLVLLPLPLQLKICRAGGHLFYHLAKSRRNVVLTNLSLCFPELDPAERERLAVEHFRAVGAFVAETAMGWYGRVDDLRAVVTIEGLENLRAGLERGHGVILFSGHFTCFEIFMPVFAPLCPRFTGMQKLQTNPVMNRMMTQGRGRSTDALFDKDNVRGMVREIKANSVFWYAADQSFASKGSALIPFFGEAAMTNTAISRIARMTGATVLPFLPRRRPDDTYLLTIGEPLEGFPSRDENADTRRLIEVLENFIRTCPEQYWWVHQRFKSRPPPYPDVYAAARSGSQT
jgi:KDO2-lipid IV(A) lauroyltransferase